MSEPWWRRWGDLTRRGISWLCIAWASRRVAKARTEEERERAREALAERLAGARGLPMKAGQVLASLSGQKEFAPLVEGVEPRRLAEIGIPREGQLDGIVFDLEESAAAASLGQVHRARLADGTPLAVKVQYPEVARNVQAELGLVGKMPAGGPVKRFAINTADYQAVLADNMDRELDYRSEAERQQRFRRELKVDGLMVPRVYPAWCSEKVLVQEWQEGVRLSAAAEWPLRDRLLVAKTLLETFLKSLFVLGEVHGDPNPGNYFFQRDEERPWVVLLDYGCTLELPAERRLALLALLFGLRAGKPLDPFAYLTVVGFDATKLVRIVEKLPAVCRILFEPFLVEGPFRPETWRLGERFQELLGEQRWWFRSAGPAEAVLLVRAFQGVIEQLKILDVALPWWPLLERSLPESLQQETQSYCPPSPNGFSVPTDLHSMASNLEVLIREDGEEIRRMSMPSDTLFALPAFLPEEARAMLDEAGVDIGAVIERITESGLAPQEVFSVEEGGRSYRAWLE